MEQRYPSPRNKLYIPKEIFEKFIHIVRKYTSDKECEQIKNEFLATYKGDNE